MDAAVGGDEDGFGKCADAVGAKDLVGAAGGKMGQVCPTAFFDEGADGLAVVIGVDGNKGEFAAPGFGVGRGVLFGVIEGNDAGWTGDGPEIEIDELAAMGMEVECSIAEQVGKFQFGSNVARLRAFGELDALDGFASGHSAFFIGAFGDGTQTRKE